MVEFLPIVRTILSGIQFVRTVGNENQKLEGEIDSRLWALEWEVRMAKWEITKYEGVDPKLAVDMQELLFHIEDFVHDLSIPEGIAAFCQSAIGVDSRPKHIPVIDSFITSIKTIRERQEASSKSSQNRDAAKEGSSSSPASPPPYAAEIDLEGFPKTKVDFRQELLSPAVGLLRVVSVVGCNGVGKTALARAVFDDSRILKSTPATNIPGLSTSAIEVPEDEGNVGQSTTARNVHGTITFHCKAWVVASTCIDAGDLLNKVLKHIDSTAAAGNTAEALRKLLGNKRYLVVIDDLQPHGVLWKDIKHAFPENDRGSRIIVTTSVHSIAKACSSASYYVYPLHCLNRAQSKRLFWKKVYGPRGSDWEPSEIEIPRSDRIFDKCGDLPLALISVANYMGEKGQDLSDDRCKDMCKTLGNYLESKKRAFDDLKNALIQRYENLPDNDHKNCLLYVSIFPRGYEINSKSLARRLLAEEFVGGDKIDDVRQWLEELIDRSMIEPAMLGSNSEVAKRCKAHGAMLDFAIQKSLSKNLVTLLGEDNDRHGDHGGRVRRLTVQSTTKLQCDDFLQEKEEWIHLQKQSKLSSVRSLTICNSGILDFKSCKMMRVLDLEGCSGLDETVLHDICELVFLKYLRIKNSSIKELPEGLKKLKYIQTLDIGDTLEIILLPVVVIMLPALVYLFGRFKLPSTPADKSELKEFLENKSELHTLAGIFIDETGVLETIIEKARKLKKVKIWCTDTSPSGTQAPALGNAPASGDATNNTPAPGDAANNAPASGDAANNIPSPTATEALGNTTALSIPRKSRRWFGACFNVPRKPKSDLVQKIARPDHATSNAKAPSTDVSRNSLVSPYPQPRASSTVPPPPSDNSVATDRLPGILVSSQIQSLCIESSGFCKAFLASLRAPCSISSIKLRGELASLPDPDILKDLRCLNKLHLSFTGLSCQALSALQKLFYLEYLTIVEESHRSWKDSFIVEDKGFPCLKVLCFEGPKHPRVEIKPGGMQHLTSLKMLCKESPVSLPNNNGNGAATECLPGVKGISHLAKLNEVILHHDSTDEDTKAWKEAAMRHTNMPSVRKQQAPQPIINAP